MSFAGSDLVLGSIRLPYYGALSAGCLCGALQQQRARPGSEGDEWRDVFRDTRVTTSGTSQALGEFGELSLPSPPAGFLEWVNIPSVELGVAPDIMREERRAYIRVRVSFHMCAQTYTFILYCMPYMCFIFFMDGYASVHHVY